MQIHRPPETENTLRRPNFLIIGAAKSGTTSLWRYLGEHEEIFMSRRKHTRFFSFKEPSPHFIGPPLEKESVPYAIPDADAYHALFRDAATEKAVGEASHSYMYRPEAARRIYDYKPDMKLIAILRNPAERAFSHHRQMMRDGREDILDFELALEAEAGRVASGWWPDFHYTGIGLYHEQLSRYRELFPKENLRVYLYEDFDQTPETVLSDIYDFLGVSGWRSPRTLPRYNASGVPRQKIVHHGLQGLRRMKPLVRRFSSRKTYEYLTYLGSRMHNSNLTGSSLPNETLRRVTAKYFINDILSLESLLERDLSHWKKGVVSAGK